MPLKQEFRMVAIKTALGPDVLALRSISVQEQISRLFQIEAELSSEDGEIDLDKVVGRDATIRLNVGQEDKRYFHGIVSRLVQVANQGGYPHYRATIVPWLWFLTRTSDCRIFQNKKIPDIIKDVFDRRGFGGDYKFKLTGSYEEWEYCVQYRETDFNFVSRLMEQEGIYYFSEHEDGKNTLVLADSISASKPFPNYAEVTFHELERGGTQREVITDWTVEKEVQPVAYALRDFDFKKPKTDLLVSANVTRQYGKAEYEIYDCPGEYLEHGEGERLADVRLNELQTQYEVLHGQANARGLAAGCTFKLKSHPRADQNREYLITSATLHADAGEFGSGGEGATFSCSFTAIDKAQQFRPPRQTAKPIVQGPQTAIVVGPAGDEIHTDPHARVKVHFHWDRHDNSDENSSCWIRVSQSNAGKGWGSMITPRIGQEVIVDFLEGDPDRPIITGRVYNADQKAPYAGGQGVVSGLKSNTHKGAGYNEMSMEDTAGKEKITIHGQYDLNTTIEHDETHTIKTGDRTIKVVVGKHTETIKGDTTIKIETGNYDHDVATGTSKHHVTGSVTEIFDDIQQTTVNKDILINSKTTKIHLTAATEIQLEVGSSKLLMKADGSISLEGVNVTINGSTMTTVKGGIVHSEAGLEHQTKGKIVLSEGEATNTVKGGMVMLNP